MKTNNQSKNTILRQKAEELQKKAPSKITSPLSESETLELIHELEVHQVELEMQNDELIHANKLVEDTTKKYAGFAKKYAELYDFAPSGYFTLSRDGDILGLNLKGAKMLGKDRLRLINNRFALYVSDDTKLNFNLFLDKVFVNKTNQTCKVVLVVTGNSPMYVHLAGALSANGEQCLVTAVDITSLKHSEVEPEQFLNFFQISPDLMVIADPNSCFTKVNPACLHLLGYSEAELLTKPFIDFVHPDDRQSTIDEMARQIKTGLSMNFENRYMCKDGTAKQLAWHANYIASEGTTYATARDITVSKKESEELVKLNRLYALISQINNLILRSDNREKLFIEVCNTAIIYGKFRMAWIGMVDDVTQIVNPVAHAGFEDGYLKIIKKISNKDIPEGRGPSGRSLCEGKTAICNDIANDPVMEPWREEAIQRGYYASISLPIIVHNRCVGTFVLYAGEPNFFSNEEEVALLEKITNNISFSLETILAEEERRKAKIALMESEERYRALVDWTPEGIAVHRDGKLLYINPGAVKMLGATSADELIGKYFMDMIHPDFHKKTMESMEALSFEGNRRPMIEEKFIRFDGKEIDVEVQGIIINFNGEPAIQSSVHDITERKRAEEKLKQLSQAIEQSPISIVITDMEGSIQYVNSKFVEVTGYSFEEAIGKNPSILKSGYTSDLEYKHLWEAITAGEEWHGELHNRKKNGDLYWESATITPILNAKGETTHFLAVKEDITGRKQAEEILAKYAAELKNSNTELENFAYVASHDLQEPLRMVTSFLNLLEKRMGAELDETTKQYIHFATDGADRMKILINDLLLYSRVGTNKEKFSSVDLNEVMEYATRVLKENIDKINAVLIVKPLPVITANKTLINQLFINLVNNSLKYHSEIDPQIEVGCTEDVDKYTFYVKDNGIGISKEYFEKVFIIFQRLHTRKEYSGIGIGLAICKKIVETHHGKIWVESEFGRGSTFYFSIPK